MLNASCTFLILKLTALINVPYSFKVQLLRFVCLQREVFGFFFGSRRCSVTPIPLLKRGVHTVYITSMTYCLVSSIVIDSVMDILAKVF